MEKLFSYNQKYIKNIFLIEVILPFSIQITV